MEENKLPRIMILLQPFRQQVWKSQSISPSNISTLSVSDITMMITQETSTELFNNLPHVNLVFPYLAANPLSINIIEELRYVHGNLVTSDTSSWHRSVFLRHGAAQHYGLSIVHRHFELGPGEMLVEYGNVSAPWQIPSIIPILKGRVLPRNWAFVGGALQPYEYRFLSEEQYKQEDELEMSEAFIDNLYDVLAKHGLENVYGPALLPADAHNEAMPPKLEFTAGRSNVTVPFTGQVEEALVEKMVYLFPCIDPLVGPGHGGPRMRHCVVCVRH